MSEEKEILEENKKEEVNELAKTKQELEETTDR